MTFRFTPKTETVHRCVPTQDGNWLIITGSGKTASSPVELPEGAQVTIRGNGACARPGEPTPFKASDMPPEPALASLAAIDRQRGAKRG